MTKFKRKLKNAVKVSNKFREYYKSQLMCDFIIFAGNNSLRCHKVILAALSPWFEDWFKRDPNCSSLKMYNFTFEQIKAILDFVYIGQFALSKKTDLSRLFSKAKSIQIDMNAEMLSEIQSENSRNSASVNDLAADSPERPSSRELMPPPPPPHPNSELEPESEPESESIRKSRYENVFNNDDMDALLPFSQVMGDRNGDSKMKEDDDNDENISDELLPFSQVIAPIKVTVPSPGQSKNPFKCDVSGCKHRFAKRRELANHKHKYHLKKSFNCPIPWCKKKFERGKPFGDHMADKHPEYVRERYKELNSQEDSNSNSTGSASYGASGEVEALNILKVEFDDNSQNIFKC